MQLKAALASAVARLTAENVPSPRMNAELLLMFTLGCYRAYLYGHPERELTAEEDSRYEAALAERSRGVPAQYITGHQEFWGMDLIVTPEVLNPRPETEHVIEAVLDLTRADLGGVGPQGPKPVSNAAMSSTAEAVPFPKAICKTSSSLEGAGGRGRPPHAIRIADVGTGSGCIALALAKELPDAEIHATDISAAALEIARANAARHQLETRIQFHRTDLLTGLDPEFDLIVSNPPYVGESEEDQVQLEVRKFEPRDAVFAGPTGLGVIARLIPQARAALRPGGWLVMEISGPIADAVRGMLEGWGDILITSDLQGVPRVARARKSSSL